MRWRTLWVAAVLICVAPSSASASARWLGFNDNSTLSQTLTGDQDARLLARAGANSARITLDWTWVEGAQGKLDLGMYDRIYKAWLRRGIRPVLIVTGSPQWSWQPWWQWPDLTLCNNSAGTCHVPPDPMKDGDWAHFVGAVAKRYPRAAAIEVWNEPIIRSVFATGPSPSRYTQLLRLAHQAVKEVAPSTPVLGGALASILTDNADGETYGLEPFLRGMYASGVQGLMDGISVHAYPTDGTAAAVFAAVDTARRVRDEAGDNVPLWVTEVGASTSGGFTDTAQAQLLSQVVRPLMRRSDVAGVYVHSLLDNAGVDPANPEHGYGVLRSATDPKPAFCTVTKAFLSVRARRKPVHCTRAAAR
jgi:hypothetical protein